MNVHAFLNSARSGLLALVTGSLVISSLALTGCARVATSTIIATDGTFTRKAVYKVPAMTAAMGAMKGMGDPKEGGGGQAPADKPEDYFNIPKPSSSVKVESGSNDKDMTVTVTKIAKIGETLDRDITVWAKKGEALLASSVTVTRRDDGLLVYEETLHWLGKHSATNPALDPELRSKVKAVIPAEHQKTEVIDKVAKGVALNMIHSMFGPPETTIGNFFFDPEGAQRKLNASLFPANVRLFRSEISALTEDQAKAMASELTKNIFVNPEQSMPSDPSSKSPDSEGNGMCTLHFEVGFPGKVVETNGIIDPVDGHVYWSMLAIAAEPEDVLLRVVIQP